MNIKKTAVIACSAACMLAIAIGAATRLTAAREMDMEVTPQGAAGDGEVQLYGKRDAIHLYYDDEELLLLPVRSVAEGLGGAVSWNSDSKEITITTKNRRLVVRAGESKAVANDYDIVLERAPETVNGRLYMDSEALSRFLSAEIVWDNESYQISIKSQTGGAPVTAVNILEGEKEGKSYSLSYPVILGLNDASYEKRLNGEIKQRSEKLAAEFTDSEETGVFEVKTETGLTDNTFLSYCMRGTRGETPFAETINIDLLNQKYASLTEVLSAEGMDSLNKQIEPGDEQEYFISEERSLVVFDISEEGIREIYFPNEGEGQKNEYYSEKYVGVFISRGE